MMLTDEQIAEQLHLLPGEPSVTITAQDIYDAAHSTPSGHWSWRSRVSLSAAAAVLAVVAIAAGTVFVLDAHRVPATSIIGSTTFVTLSVTYPPSSPVASKQLSSVSWQLDLRSIADGHIVRTLVGPGSTAIGAASRMSDGAVLLAEGVADSCATRLVRIDPVSGRGTVVRELDGEVEELAVSPDDKSVAYLTWSPPISPCHIAPGLMQRGPDRLAVTNLLTGATRTIGALWGVSWSPDGTRIIGGNEADGLTIIDSVALGTNARQLTPPADCRYGYALWTVTGIYTDETCGLRAASVSPGSSAIDNLVQLDDRGATGQSWRLPACGGVGTLVTDGGRRQVLLNVSLGFGNQGQCAVQKVHGNQIEIIDGARLRTVLRIGDSRLTLLAG